MSTGQPRCWEAVRTEQTEPQCEVVRIMVFVSRAVNQVCGLLVKILSAVTRGFRRSFGLSIPSAELVVGSFTRISQLFTLGSALLGGGAAMMGWRARAIAISLTFSTIAVLTVTAGSSFYPYMGQRAQERERLESALLRPMADSLPGATPIRFPDHAAPMGATIVGQASHYKQVAGLSSPFYAKRHDLTKANETLRRDPRFANPRLSCDFNFLTKRDPI